MRIVLGACGGIAAYKACSLLRLLTEAGHDVTVVPTASALHFVGAATWAALSGKPVQTDVWTGAHEVPHVRLGQDADLVVVAPATANLLAKAAHGLADDLLTATLLTARCPVVLAPAMHTEMWEHPATQANVETLTERGVHVVPPASGRLTGADSGSGRLPEPEQLYAVCRRLLEATTAPAGDAPAPAGDAPEADRPSAGRPSAGDSSASDPSVGDSSAGDPSAGDSSAAGSLAGRRVVVTAGGTREPLDPVRFLGNRSSGKQGYALAAVATARGAQVTLIAANVALPAPDGTLVVPVGSALDLRAAVLEAAEAADVVVMAAAVADFRPRHVACAKIKKSHDPADPQAPTIELVRNPDILAELVRRRGDGEGPVIVGFAAETGDLSGTVLEHGRAKLERKGCDLLVVNEVGAARTFGQDENTVHILRLGSTHVLDVGPAPKEQVAAAVWDCVQQLR